ncbi:MAG: apolipoprotein N-acyltransferase [Rickettsiales bacterium]|jgi:apolipoprotein N-acyltransferase|nr:apolipoprotein N-acyltransferase [Rickettsiales bacterium]
MNRLMGGFEKFARGCQAVGGRFPKAVRVSALVVFGLLGGVGFIPYWWSWVPFSLYLSAQFYVLQSASTRIRAGLQVWAMCALAYFVSFHWIETPFEWTTFGWVAPVVHAVFVICFSGGTIGLASLFAYKRGLAAFSAAVVLGEWIKSWIFTGFPWSTVAHIWQNSVVLQALALVGTFGLAFITAFLLTWSKEWRRARAGLAVFVLLFGAGRLYMYGDVGDSYLFVRGVSIDNSWDRNPDSKLDTYLKYSRIPIFRPIGLIVWPESGLRYDISNDKEAAKTIIGALGANALLTFDRRDVGEDGAILLRNSMGLLTTDGRLQIYDKIRLVPFGEYVPPLIPGISKFTEGTVDFSAGTEQTVMSVMGMRFVPLICFEIIFPGLRLPQDVDFMVNTGNDMWISRQGKLQIAEMARFRAIEEGMPVLRVSNTGVSGIISPLGEYRKRLFGDGVMDGFMPRRVLRPLFSWTGNLPVLVFVAIVLVFAGRKGRKGQ